ncbi:prepilin peptidase [Paucilactobacillus nenjiangensis]|uniref:prepilin peptidase n=1 Tax=Paucilactobacillus nenjiangensis TaxID=1296540 RepID=UPI003BB05B47
MSIIAFLYGTVLASFITLCADRIPKHVSILYPRSRCDNCQVQLRYWQLIPIFGYLFQLGHCKNCHHHISPISTCVELIIGLIALHAPLNHPLQLICFILFYGFLLFISLTDLSHQFFYSTGLLGLLPGIFIFESAKRWEWQLGCVMITTLLFLLLLAHLTNGLGSGDIELILIFEILLDFEQTMWIICISSLLALFTILLTRHQSRIPFVPFLSLGFLIVTQIFYYM